MRSSLRHLLAGCVLAGAVTGPALAQDYPSRDIRMVVPWGAGGGTDAIVRKISSMAEADLPNAIYVENIEGGLSGTGVMQVMNAQPDGHTVAALTYDSVVTVPWQGLVPRYDLDKLAPVARITSEPDALMLAADAPYADFDALIAAARENPGEVTIGIQGLGSRTHLAMLRVEEATGVDFNLVSYPGGAAGQKEALLSGEIAGAVTSMGDFAPLLDAGDARGVVEFSAAPNPAYPDVPIAADVGLDVEIGSFIVLTVPAGTPEAAITTLEETFHEAHQSDEFQTWLADIGVTSAWLGAEETGSWMRDTQEEIFALMDALAEEGVINKP